MLATSRFENSREGASLFSDEENCSRISASLIVLVEVVEVIDLVELVELGVAEGVEDVFSLVDVVVVAVVVDVVVEVVVVVDVVDDDEFSVDDDKETVAVVKSNSTG